MLTLTFFYLIALSFPYLISKLRRLLNWHNVLSFKHAVSLAKIEN